MSDHHKAHYMYIGIYIQKYIHYYVSHRGEVLVGEKMYHICYQKDHTSSRIVSVHMHLSYDASRAHRRVHGDNSII